MMEDRYEAPAPSFRWDELMAILERRKSWLILSTLLGITLAIAAINWLPATYSARSTILYQPRQVTKEFVRSTLQESVRQELATIRERITSHEQLSGMLDRLGRERLDPDREASDGALIHAMRRSVALEIGNAFSPDAQVFELVYEAGDPYLAVDAVRGLTDLFIASESGRRSEQAEMTAEFLSTEAERVATELAVLGERIREVRRRLPQGAARNRDSSVIARQEAALQAARAKLAAARARYTEEHPEVQGLSREVGRLQARTRSRDVMSPRDSEALLDYEQLLRDEARLAANYEEIRSKQLDARLSSNLEVVSEGSQFQVLSPPTLPRVPDSPNPQLFLIGGTVGGIGIGLLIIAALELLRPSFRSVNSLIDATNIPVMASIPRIETGQLDLREEFDGVVDEKLVVLTCPESAAAEQYRAFIPVMMERDYPDIILVTSASRGDGKSLACANLAAAVATGCEREVLLIDADMRRPSAHRVLGKRTKYGLRDVLRGEVSFDDAVVATPCPHLSLLPAGRPTHNPTPLLTSPRFMDLIQKARNRHAPIFIDAPPLGPVVDARVLRQLAQMVLFVVRADTTPRAAAIRSLEDLGDVAGLVFNDVRSGPYRRYYYEESNASYVYGELDDE